jgi:hypothetical protein
MTIRQSTISYRDRFAAITRHDGIARITVREHGAYWGPILADYETSSKGAAQSARDAIDGILDDTHAAGGYAADVALEAAMDRTVVAKPMRDGITMLDGPVRLKAVTDKSTMRTVIIEKAPARTVRVEFRNVSVWEPRNGATHRTYWGVFTKDQRVAVEAAFLRAGFRKAVEKDWGHHWIAPAFGASHREGVRGFGPGDLYGMEEALREALAAEGVTKASFYAHYVPKDHEGLHLALQRAEIAPWGRGYVLADINSDEPWSRVFYRTQVEARRAVMAASPAERVEIVAEQPAWPAEDDSE